MGTPLVTLMLERSAQTIEQVIIPNLTGAVEVEQAMWMANLLHILAPMVEEKARELEDENEGIREVLGNVLEALREETASSRNPIGNALMERLDRELNRSGGEPAHASEENSSLKGTLVEAIRGLDALSGELPEETLSFLRQRIRSVLRQQMDRGVARVIDRMGGLPL